MSDDMGIRELLVLEYQHLKEEQRMRIGIRDNLIYATLGSIAAVVVVALQSERVSFLLLVPPVCLILGWTYHVNDDRITAIGNHIEQALVTRFAAEDSAVFSWERSHRADAGRRRRKIWQLCVDLLTYVGVPVIALGFVAQQLPWSVVGATACLVEGIAAAALAGRFIASAVRRVAVPTGNPSDAGVRSAAA
ncbi:hypothetical protein AB0M43_35495 [Longispora sp. NPDC051575]|uniref:hypothetical protein n=1 Tax=Longispora sp. NPDC051575 TaxID=3154943 RepID=UPI003428F330